MEGFIILDWVSVVSLIMSTLISGGIGYFFKRKFEKDRRKFEEDRDKLKREFEKDLLSIKTNFEKEIYTYKARYDHKVKMMMEMFELVHRYYNAGLHLCGALDEELYCFLKKFKDFESVETRKMSAFRHKYSPFVKKKVIENFEYFGKEAIKFIARVYVFWYENKFLIEKDKYDNINFEDLRKDYEWLKSICRGQTKFCDGDAIPDQYTKRMTVLVNYLSEQVREYLNEK